MDIKADLWFPTVVWNYQLKQINNAELRDYVINFRQEDPGKRASNYGGWQTVSYTHLTLPTITGV